MKGPILQANSDGTLGRTQRVCATTIVNDTMSESIRAALQNDTLATNVLANPEQYEPQWTKDNGMLLFQGLLYVPTPCRKDVIRSCHDSALAGHEGIEKTIARIASNYYFPGMRKDVTDHIAQCNTCQTTKHARHRPYGLLQPLQVANRPWQSVSLDFIVKLPKSQEPLTKVAYDSILVIVDRFTKYSYFLPYLESSTAEDLSYTFLRTIVANHGVPEQLVSDRDKLFTSNFWKSLMKQLGTEHKLSTSFHPQTDGQTERTNQTLEQYLRGYVNYEQDNWVVLLPTAQHAHNTSPSADRGLSPHEALFGTEPETRLSLDDFAPNDSATTKSKRIATLHEELQKDLQFLRHRMAYYANQRRVSGPTLKEGDKVYLLRRNIKTKRASNKLDFTKLGPFEIKRKRGAVSFELRLPKKMSMHPVFHISLLEPAHPNATLQTQPPEIEDDFQSPQYEVERILDDRLEGGQKQYLVRWKGYDHTEDTWEPKSHFISMAPLRLYYQCRQRRDPQRTTGRQRESRPRQRVTQHPPP